MSADPSNDHGPPPRLTEGVGPDEGAVKNGRAYLPGPVRAEGFTALRPPADPSKPDALGLLRAMRRRWLLALCAGLLGALTTAALAWLLIPKSMYTARAMLQVYSIQPNIIFKTTEARADFATYQRTQQTLIKSRLVLVSALRDRKVAPLGLDKRHSDPVAWLEKQIQAAYAGEVLSISMTSDRPPDLAVLVNAVTDAYLREIVNVEESERRRRYEELKDIYNTYQGKLQSKRDILKTLADQIGASNKSTVRYTHELTIERLGLAQRELMTVRNDLRRAETELKVHVAQSGRKGDEAEFSEAIVQDSIRQDRKLADLVITATKLEGLVSQTRRRVRFGSDPSLQQKMFDLESAQAVAARRAEIRPGVIENLKRSGRFRQDPTVGSMEERVEVLRELESMAAADVETLTKQSQSLNKNSMSLESLQEELAHSEGAAKKVGDEVEALSVELHAPARVKLIESADTPRQETDKRQSLAAISGVCAFALIVFGVSWREFRTRRIGSVEEVIHGLGLPLVGSLPAIPDRPRRFRGSASRQEGRWRHQLNESVDALRTIILHTSAVGSIRSIMVMSATGGEGKTSLVSHLVTSFARAGRKTLLLDCDLRRPSAHHLFDLPLSPGFCEVLRGEVSVDEAVRLTSVSGVWMMSAGHCDAMAIRALAQDGLKPVLSRLRDHFDFVVVDTSPVLAVADALLIGQHVDAAICSIRRDVSRAPQVAAAYERLSTLGIRILGVVMAGVDGGGYGYGYGQGYHRDYTYPLQLTV